MQRRGMPFAAPSVNGASYRSLHRRRRPRPSRRQGHSSGHHLDELLGRDPRALRRERPQAERRGILCGSRAIEQFQEIKVYASVDAAPAA